MESPLRGLSKTYATGVVWRLSYFFRHRPPATPAST